MDLDGAEVVIVGGGVSGLSAGWWLARSGVDTIVVEKGVIGWEASGRNGGSTSHRGNEFPVVPLAAESLRLWPNLSEELGYPTEWQPGRLNIAMNEQDMQDVYEAEEVYREHYIQSEIIDGDAVRDMLPMASQEVLGASYSTTAGNANPQRTVQAYAWAFLDNGGRLHQNTAVQDFDVSGDRVTAVLTDRGRIAADFVVCAAGPQTGLLAEKVGAFVPVSPGRVEILVTAPIEPMWGGLVFGNGLYGRQTRRGNLAYGGGPHEWTDVGMETPHKPNTPLVRNISRRVAELFPSADEVPVIRSWAGVVEQTPDLYPIIDTLTEPSNFLIATTSAHGFGISPATGKVVRDLVVHAETPVDISRLAWAGSRMFPLTGENDRARKPEFSGPKQPDWSRSNGTGRQSQVLGWPGPGRPRQARRDNAGRAGGGRH